MLTIFHISEVLRYVYLFQMVGVNGCILFARWVGDTADTTTR